MADLHQCAKCGLVAGEEIASGYITPYGPLSEDARRTGRWHGYRSQFPYCIALVADFEAEIQAAKTSGVQMPGMGGIPIGLNPDDLRKHILNRDRPCDEFTEWVPGLSLKDHWDLKMSQQLREWQARRDDALAAREDARDEALRDWQQEQERRSEERHKQDAADAERRHKAEMGQMKQIHETEMGTIGRNVTVTVIVASLIITILGSAIQAGWFPKWFGLTPDASSSPTAVPSPSPTFPVAQSTAQP